ncbi:MAG TPA: hypothetical protein VM166_00105 [Gemmatimonadaceae bacterium]|nr:hypothetical protein [Gemmatimonadaceae bacterium]
MTSTLSTSVSAHARGSIVLAALIVGSPAIAQAQVSPQGAHHTSVGGGAGLSSPLSPTGGFAASVPLDLPSPRGGLPVPLSIVYNGSTRAGAAGVGWDVPLSYVSRSRGAFKRKPSTADGSAAERIYVSLGGAPQLMVPHGGAYVPYKGTEYSELRSSGDGWVLRTLDNIEYTFSTLQSIGYGNGDFWLLTQIRDLTGTDRVSLKYDTYTACNTGEFGLSSLSYGYNASGVPLYEIALKHRRYDPDSCVAIDNVSIGLFSRMTRWRVLESITIRARNNLDPGAQSALRQIRRYDLVYGVEQDTNKPGIIQAWVFGEEGSGAPPLPVGTYGYGHVSSPPEVPGGQRNVTFGPWEAVPRPNTVTGSVDYKNDISTSDVYSYDVAASPFSDFSWVRGRVDTTRARHLLRDFTGDGVPDLLVHRGEGTVGRSIQAGSRPMGLDSPQTVPR